MKNIFLGTVFTMVFLPQASFAQNQAPAVNPRTAACNQTEDVESNAFFKAQSEERGAFMKANPEAITRHDQHFQAMLAIDMAQRVGKSTAGLPPVPDDDPAFLAFQQKQQNDKTAFLSKFYQERQNCLNGQPGTNP